MKFEEWTKKATNQKNRIDAKLVLALADWEAEREKLMGALRMASRELHHASSNPGTRTEVAYSVDAILAEIDAKGGGK